MHTRRAAPPAVPPGAPFRNLKPFPVQAVGHRRIRDAMTAVLVTIDTELSAGLFQRGTGARANLESSVFGACAGGRFGIGWQMDRLEAHGLKGVFFVDPMPALVYGAGPVEATVAPIVARGHEVQLHLHPEWLAWADAQPVGAARGQSIADFAEADQRRLLALGLDLLAQAGAPRPIAFRAGNYGADDATLRALASLGLAWDSSFNAAYLGAPCRIGLPAATVAPVRREGVVELPVAALHDRPGHLRPAQLCALSAAEMRAALAHAAMPGQPPFVIVSHSFELLSRDRQRPNRAVIARFEAMCRAIAATPGLESAGFADLDPALADRPLAAARLGPSWPRTAARIAAQAIATIRYDRSLRP